MAGASADEVYEAMDWLLARQDGIEAGLARRLAATEAELAKIASMVEAGG